MRVQQTKTNERYVQEWLSNQAASGYLTYDAASGRFSLPPEYVPLLADDTSEVFMPPGFGIAQVLYVDEPKISEAMKTGEGVGGTSTIRACFQQRTVFSGTATLRI